MQLSSQHDSIAQQPAHLECANGALGGKHGQIQSAEQSAEAAEHWTCDVCILGVGAGFENAEEDARNLVEFRFKNACSAHDARGHNKWV